MRRSQLFTGVLVALAGLLLVACSAGGDSDGDPDFTITSVYYFFQNHPLDYWSGTDATCAISVTTYFSGDLAASDIEKVLIVNSTNELSWGSTFNTAYFDAARKSINTPYYYTTGDQHRMPLGNYTISIQLKSGKTVSSPFTAVGPGKESGTYTYSDSYTGVITGQVPALEIASVDSASWSGTTLTVALSGIETRATNGYLLCYDSAGSFLGSTLFFKTPDSSDRPGYYSTGGAAGTGTVTINDIVQLSGFTNIGAIAKIRPVVMPATYEADKAWWTYNARSVGALTDVAGSYSGSMRASSARSLTAPEADAFASEIFFAAESNSN